MTRKALKLALKSLPKLVNETYDVAITWIRDQGAQRAKVAERVIWWVVCARRVLTVHELQHMYTMQLRDDAEVADEDHVGKNDTDEDDLDLDELPDADLLTAVRGGLIVIDAQS